jgi:hypothetical protein
VDEAKPAKASKRRGVLSLSTRPPPPGLRRRRLPKSAGAAGFDGAFEAAIVSD